MKNITVALDDETYRKARIAAAQREVSVSALVKKFLVTLTAEIPPSRNLKREQEVLLDSIWQRHSGFTTTENLSRDDLHERHALH